jgi:hypothetical protein
VIQVRLGGLERDQSGSWAHVAGEAHHILICCENLKREVSHLHDGIRETERGHKNQVRVGPSSE